mmetsp:Transcript_20221/g.66218  ORF Transcript_20221/g.66218 Transcript_20221/m.66218 type:complete len:311 (-) Transcript_20221:538-1470(-)
MIRRVCAASPPSPDEEQVVRAIAEGEAKLGMPSSLSADGAAAAATAPPPEPAPTAPAAPDPAAAAAAWKRSTFSQVPVGTAEPAAEAAAEAATRDPPAEAATRDESPFPAPVPVPPSAPPPTPAPVAAAPVAAAPAPAAGEGSAPLERAVELLRRSSADGLAGLAPTERQELLDALIRSLAVVQADLRADPSAAAGGPAAPIPTTPPPTPPPAPPVPTPPLPFPHEHPPRRLAATHAVAALTPLPTALQLASKDDAAYSLDSPANVSRLRLRLAHGMVRWYLTTAVACGVSHPFCAVSHHAVAQHSLRSK